MAIQRVQLRHLEDYHKTRSHLIYSITCTRASSKISLDPTNGKIKLLLIWLENLICASYIKVFEFYQLPDRVVLDADLVTKDRVELFLSVHPYSLYETIKANRNRSSYKIRVDIISMQNMIWITAKQRFTSVTQGSSEQGMSLSDTIQLSIYCRVTIWISFYVKTR